jgi:hypothetical protein
MYSLSSHLNYLDLSAPKILALVIIDNLNIISPFVPTKTNPPLLINTDTKLAFSACRLKPEKAATRTYSDWD